MQSLMVPSWYEPPAGPAGRYKIRGLSGLEYLEWRGLVEADAGANLEAQIASGEVALSPRAAGFQFVLKAGVSDWEDLSDEAIVGGAGAFKPERLKDLCLDHMTDVANEILRRSVMTEELEKNSSSRSKSPATESTSIAEPANGAGIAAQ